MYLLLAVAAGFASVYLWGFINRSYEGWYNVCWRVSCYFPGIALGLLTVLNLMIWHTGSSGAIPLGAFFSLVSLWFIISIPLCYSGAPPQHCKADATAVPGTHQFAKFACTICLLRVIHMSGQLRHRVTHETDMLVLKGEMPNWWWVQAACWQRSRR